MELEIYIAGIGGQGVQLMAKTLALAALAEDRHVQLSAEYGFTMRGGSSLATVVIGTKPLRALPVAASAGAAIVMHHKYLETPLARLRPGALIVTDTQVVPLLPPFPNCNVIDLPAADAAQKAGSPLAAGLALLCAFNGVAGLVRNESLIAAMRDNIPSYRQQHIDANTRAMIAGAQLAAEASSLPPKLFEEVVA